MANDKVNFNLLNLYYAPCTVGENGVLTYGKPKRFPGSTSMNIELEQSEEKAYSEGVVYATVQATSGYKIELETYTITDEFESEVLGLTKDSNGVLVEQVDVQPKPIALLYEIGGDAGGYRGVLYNVVLKKPKYEHKTNTDKTELQTLKLEGTGLVDENRVGRAKIRNTTETKALWDSWFTEVKKPNIVKSNQ